MNNPESSDNNPIDYILKLDLSVYDIAAILKFLATCDMALACANDELSKEDSIGRSYLMDMLGNCVSHMDEQIEDAGITIETLHDTIKSTNQRQDELSTLHGLYQQLIAFSPTGDKGGLAQLKMDILALEQTLGLQGSDALTDFATQGSEVVAGDESKELV